MFNFLVEALVRSSILIAGVWGLLQLCRVRHASGQKFVWTLVVAVLLVMPLLIGSIVAGSLSVAILPAQLAVPMDVIKGSPPAAHWLGIFITAVYAVGAVILGVRLAVGLVLGARLRQAAQPVVAPWAAGLDVRLSANVHAPVSFGSTVLLPRESTGWDAATLRAVLAHEREHIRNRDGCRLWLASLCRAIFWFNPLVHWLNRRLAVLAELTSDAAAVDAIGDRSTYLQVLLRIAGTDQSPEVLIPMASRINLPARIRQLLRPDEPSLQASSSRKSLLGCAIVLLSAAVAACAAKPIVLTGPAAAAALHISRAPTVEGLESFYSDMLRRGNIQGRAVVRITVDAHGHVVDTRLVSEAPAGVGLGAAAQNVARAYQFDNTLHRPVITTLPVKFALHPSASASPAARPAPQG